jgi:pimeloyl-ACP methyl ester carboxylesterase
MVAAMLALGLTLCAAPGLETQFVEVAPARDGIDWVRSPAHERAVVLIHGLLVHPFSKTNAARAVLHGWQKPDSLLVKRLSGDSDVYAFAYAQTVPADEVADCPDLAAHVQRLRRVGYREVVLVGHSAGGLIARQFVEDHPEVGVTKVIQVCAPNEGSSWANWQAVRGSQVDFLDSLTKTRRRETLKVRSAKAVPASVAFACVVGVGAVTGDGLVLCRSQWPDDLQRQGVPAYPLNCTHFFAVRTQKAAELLAGLVREPLPRWDASRVSAARRALLGGL